MGANYDEILYADDTVCISEDTKTMNQFLKAIEKEGGMYGLKRSRSKCELLNTGNANVHFENGEQVKQKQTKVFGVQTDMEITETK